MINQSRLEAILEAYKKDFSHQWWENEKFKWEAVKCFQDNWDINADNFTEMLEASLEKTHNLLHSHNYFPKGMIIQFAEVAEEQVRNMFRELFDERKDIYERIDKFKNKAAEIHKEYRSDANSHYQNENSISTYLWLRFPDKYYIYKYSIGLKVSKQLGFEHQLKKGSYEDNLKNFLSLYNEINTVLKKDTELINLFKSKLDEKDYPDPELKTLTIDLGFYINQKFDLSIEDWKKLLEDEEVFDNNTLQLIKCIKDFSKDFSFIELANKYGGSEGNYLETSNILAKRVSAKHNIPVVLNDNEELLGLLYEKKSDKYKLIPSLNKSLENFDLENIELKAPTLPVKEPNYWLIVTNPKAFNFSDLVVNEAQPLKGFQNFSDQLKTEDQLILIESIPVNQIIGIGKTTSIDKNGQIFIEKKEALSSPIPLKSIINDPEFKTYDSLKLSRKGLYKLDQNIYKKIIDLIREENPELTSKTIESYTKKNFLDEVYLSSDEYEDLLGILRYNKNLILQGPPGVGKTYTARRLAWSMMGEKDDSRIEFIQFHENYSYEDFIMGYRPNEENFELKYGVFYQFCKKASNYPNKDFFFIIDEINRGNMSKIFGELLMLIEKDYRGTKAKLPYTGLSFSVPENLFIIGTMNTADRSIAMIDFALRRRFKFFEMSPGFESDGFKNYQNSLQNKKLDNLISKIKDLNREIKNDQSLGKGFLIGHSYFCNQNGCTDQWINSIVNYDIIPTLNEYWFDNPDKVKEWERNLKLIIND